MHTSVTKDNRTISIKQPIEEDAQAIINYAKMLFASTDQVLTTLEEYAITLDEERNWIRMYAEKPDALILIAEVNNEVVGLLDFITKPRKKVAHSGEFGVSVHPNFQAMGIGRLLIETLLKWAEENDRIEKVILNVFHTNEHAIRLYQSLGFREEGRHVKAIKQPTGAYVDLIQMYKEVK